MWAHVCPFMKAKEEVQAYFSVPIHLPLGPDPQKGALCLVPSARLPVLQYHPHSQSFNKSPMESPSQGVLPLTHFSSAKGSRAPRRNWQGVEGKKPSGGAISEDVPDAA